ncbi:MAG: helix-turn-helix transcriptional regulator, partial [Butyrivibrio sp.]|nr:helix-turn-helix transcriptional regulator [Butyrivibrio sp.]
NSVDYAALGMKIKDLRLKRGLTQDQLSELVGCNISHISNIENNYTKLSLNILLAIANALDTTIDYLLATQYTGTSSGLDSAIIKALKDCDDEKKERILQMIELM